jgi:hypothetical protein
VNLNLCERAFLDDHKVVSYDKFEATLGNTKYDLIAVDGPYGHQARKYARVDVMGLIPGCLAASFVMMVDDYNRKGEQNTVAQIKKKLDEHAVSYSVGMYSGQKDVLLICSSDLRHLCTL